MPGLPRPPGVVLVHGLADAGKDEPRLRAAAQLLARAGWAVAVPTVPGLRQLRLRPEDARPVEAAARALAETGHAPVSILAVSLGAGPAMAAAAALEGDSRSPVMISAVLLLGGYASARELLRFTLTGDTGPGGAGAPRRVDEEDIARFARANADLLDRGGAALVANRDPERVPGLLAALPPSTRRLLDDLSPAGYLERVAAPLFLVHGRDDPVVPFTESMRLAEAAHAAGRPARLALVGAVGHVEGGGARALADLCRIWASFYAFRATARG